MLDKLELSSDNQFNGMNRDEFKQMLENMGFEVEDTDDKGYITFDDEDKLQEQIIEDLQLYGGCKVCLHCDIDKYPCNGYCDLGGCCGGCTGKIKEDMWKYRGVIDYKQEDTKEVEKILKKYDKKHSVLMDKLAKE